MSLNPGPARNGSAPGGPVPQDDPRVIAALREYLAALEAGQRPDRREVRARFPEVADALSACLEALDFVHAAAPRLGPPAGPPPDEPAAFPEPAPLHRLGDFQVLGEIGRGGMGIVYEAVQLSLGRRVALKVLPFAAALDPRQLQRFRNEAQAAAHLHHTNIVPIFGVGCDRGVHFYAMQFIEGRTLAALIQDFRRAAALPGEDEGPSDDPLPETASAPGLARPARASSPDAADPAPAAPGRPAADREHFRRVARLGMQAALALEYAHQLGVVHRDIKPANLLVDVRGNLWVTDFGLAQIKSHDGPTMTGDVMGTLRYMSPEQALARRGVTDHRTDIYSLGVTLYELLTLEPPFPGRDRHELLHQITFDEPRPPRRRNRAVPVELETVVLKALEKDPAQRYATAQELADDLGRFLEDRPVLARRPRLPERLRKWARRHRPVVTTAAVLGVLSLVGLAAAVVQIGRERDLTRAALQDADLARRRSEACAVNIEKHRRQLAEEHLQIRAALNQVFTELGERRWAHLPGINDLRREVAGKMLRVFEDALKRDEVSPGLRFEAGWAHYLVGAVYCEQCQFARARRAYGKAIDVFRGLVNDFPGDPTYRGELALCHGTLGYCLMYSQGDRPALEQFRQAAAQYRRAVQDHPPARTLNNAAWFLITCPYPALRDIRRAVTLAEEAVAVQPRCGECWNTLGAAYYRAGRWKDAIGALQRSMKLRSGGDGFDFFFLAMAHWRAGDRTAARHWFAHGVKQMEMASGSNLEPVSSYRAEAARVLGIKDKAKSERAE